ncbi:MAG: transglycosylase SLT domain-containing protein [Daejeonella sp.]|uniref:lytic transglycosylase domain-containing protein n=1 Tax=Daejeonella sp. TaxID=2805397 RepID=UPI003C779344
MRKILTFAALVILCAAYRTNASPISGKDNFADTLRVASPLATPDLSNSSLFYGHKLSSLQKSVPLDYNGYVQEYIDKYLSRKEQIGKMLGLSEYYFPIFEKALKDAGLPEELKFMTIIESSLNPLAVSKSGAVGPWQFMYTTAKGYGLVMDSFVDERRDPVKASNAAAHYFVDAYKRVGDWLLTIAAFNCGTGAVTRAIAKSGGEADFWKVRSFLPRETQNYVPAFIATVYLMNYYKDHGIESRPPAFNISTDIFQVKRNISISSVAEAAHLDIKDLMVLNPSYKKQIINGSEEAPKTLVIPGLEYNSFASLYNLLNGDSVEKPSKASPETIETRNKSYIVKVGDTLSGIAEKFNGMTVSKIKALNGLTQSAINPGMRLIISSL